MVERLFKNTETRRIFIYLGAAGICAIIGGTIYSAAIHAVTPSLPRPPAISTTSVPAVPSGKTVVLKGQTIRVRVADNDASRERGLSGSPALVGNEGMLFIFPVERAYAFWMKDMLFSIDILWFSNDGKLVHIERAASPESYPSNFVPPQPARYVLELPAGWSDAHDVSLGDSLTI